MDAGEVQILRGPGLTVTSKRVIAHQCEIPVAATSAPQIEPTVMPISAMPLVLSIGGLIFALGLFAGGPLFWILGLGVMAFSPAAKIKRHAFSVSVENDGVRRSVYTTHSEPDAKLALAALVEAQKRSAS